MEGVGVEEGSRYKLSAMIEGNDEVEDHVVGEVGRLIALGEAYISH